MTDQTDLQMSGGSTSPGTPHPGMFSPGGVDATSLMSSIAGFADLGSRQVDHDRLLAAEGAGHIVHDLPLRTDGRMVGLESRPWRLDPIPFVLESAEFAVLRSGAIATTSLSVSMFRAAA